MWCVIQRYWLVVGLFALAVGIGAFSVRNLLQTEAKRVEYERYLYRALESCRVGTPNGSYGLLLRARSFAPTEADEDLVRKLIPKFRAGNCDLPGVGVPISHENDIPEVNP